MKIACVGLGQMGKGIAMNMIKCGQELLVSDALEKTFDEFRAKSIATTTDPQEVAKCDIIFFSLPDTKIVISYLFGEHGIANSLRPGQIICDLSTISYAASIDIHEKLTALGVSFMDAPVSGMEAKALDGTLTIMCGGDQQLFDELMPYFQCIGKNILLMGKIGSGQLTKAINNTMFNINIAGFAEMIPFAVKLGLDPEQIISVINSSSGRSYASEFFLPRVLKRSFVDGYPMEHAYKDLVCTAELSAQQHLLLPVMHAALGSYQTALLKGLGKHDKGAMTMIYEELFDVKVEPKNK